MCGSINWNQQRDVYRDPETGEFYVRVWTGYMLVDDYTEGGPVEEDVAPLELVGTFTNAQIDNRVYNS